MFVAATDLGVTRRWDTVVRGEPERGPDLEALPLPVLFVGVDAVVAPGRDVLKAEQLVHRGWQRRPAVLADVEACPRLEDAVKVAADFAPLDPVGQELVVVGPLGGKQDLFDQVARALVVDDAPGPNSLMARNRGRERKSLRPELRGGPGSTRTAAGAGSCSRAGSLRSRSSGSCRSRTGCVIRRSRQSTARVEPRLDLEPASLDLARPWVGCGRR